MRIRESHLDKLIASMKEIGAKSSEAAYELEVLREYRDALFSLSPYKVGDRVVLMVTPEINAETSWGWLHAKHYLIPGAIGSVCDVDWRNGHFSLSVEFDNESWKDREGSLHPVDKKHLYTMPASFFANYESFTGDRVKVGSASI